MSNELNHAQPPGNGGFEHRDISPAPILYFLAGLLVAGVIVHFVATGLFSFMQKRSEARQAPVNALVTNAPEDTRHIPAEYNGNYEKYLKKNFPAPQLEIDERTELNSERLHEEQTLSTYGWVDEKAGIVRIPIDRSIDLLAQRGLPVRANADNTASPKSTDTKKKGSQQ